MTAPKRRCEKCGAEYGSEVVFCPADGAPISNRNQRSGPDPLLGHVVRGEFRLEQLLGVGAMGRVYRAHQLFVERPVAVKILHEELLADAALVARFQREAQATARIRSPHVISVLSAGTLDVEEGKASGAAYIVLEYLDGLSLRSLLAGSGTLPLPRALDIALQVGLAVGEAHRLAVVHRDLKPENVMLVQADGHEDFVKVLDFGMARFDQGSSEFRTRAGAVLGTARYISPEGARGEPVGPPADVYSLGTILFECLAGDTPFNGQNAVAILLRQAGEPAPNIRATPLGAAVPAPLASFLARCLSKAPAERPEHGRAFCRELLTAAAESGLSLETLPSASGELVGARTLKLPHALPDPAPRADFLSVEQNAPRADSTPSGAPAKAKPHSLRRNKSAEPSALRRLGWVFGCFVLGALGALLIARQLGAFSGSSSTHPVNAGGNAR
jgi:serine/threonine protein kinase